MNCFRSILIFALISTYAVSAFDLSQMLEQSTTVSATKYLGFPLVNQEEHSMAHALPEYVTQKIPTSLINEVIDKGWNIEIIGSPPPILETITPLEEVIFSYEKKKDKAENFRRPSYYFKEKTLIVSVMAGIDYLRQFTALISYYIKFNLGKNPDDIVKVTSFPMLENNIGLWTHLDNNFVKPKDTVLIGNVSDYFDHLKKEGVILQGVEESENFYYKASRVKVGNRFLTFLRVKYSFWGNMSANLVRTLLDLGASEIIYMSKIATLDNPEHIYKKIYSPTRFSIIENHQVENIQGIINPLVERFPELDSGKHVSLGTVMEQDFTTSALAHSVADSLDLEVSKVAKVVAEYNLFNKKEIPFVPIHWVTDYLRTKEEAHLDTGFDLSNGDSISSKERKAVILKRIYHFVTAYLLEAELVVQK